LADGQKLVSGVGFEEWVGADVWKEKIFLLFQCREKRC